MSVVLATGAAAVIAPSSPHHPDQLLRRYEHARRMVASRLGHRAPGRDIARYGLPNGHAAPRRVIRRSLGVLERMLHPAPRTVSATPLSASIPTPVSASAPAPSVTAPAGGLVACIISHESSGNPQASNGAHSGLGGWDQTAWQQDGGTRYAPTPTGASYSQQVAVLNSEGSSPQGYGQQTNFDGC